ncbi:unnamed protein product [Chrysodeixis includens]|uniref:Uncharacterized protein n=1 Tax=Chrysodeixis includens TaxID=689277 RepID=A0A9N8L122_CHRIL|nr:unnamed protein product [Chrysodeixis includens]
MALLTSSEPSPYIFWKRAFSAASPSGFSSSSIFFISFSILSQSFLNSFGGCCGPDASITACGIALTLSFFLSPSNCVHLNPSFLRSLTSILDGVTTCAHMHGTTSCARSNSRLYSESESEIGLDRDRLLSPYWTFTLSFKYLL